MGRFKTPDVEESVGCNLIPMIDIMFLLLLFFMLGADMTQRELEDVILPKADQAKEDSKEKTDETGFTTINIHHMSSGPCAAYDDQRGSVCSEGSHWIIAIRGKNLNQAADLAERLDWEAKQELEPPDAANPGRKPMSKRKISIRADAKCLYEQVQRLIEACGKAGLYKIEVGAAKPAPDGPPG